MPIVWTVSCAVVGEKVAVTDFAALIVSVHAPAPLHAPLQPSNRAPAAGVAVNVTTAPVTYNSAQSAPQLMPAGELVTVPLPAPAFVTVKAYLAINVAVTFLAAFIVTAHVPVPKQLPDHPLKAEFAAGVAVSVTIAPAL